MTEQGRIALLQTYRTTSKPVPVHLYDPAVILRNLHIHDEYKTLLSIDFKGKGLSTSSICSLQDYKQSLKRKTTTNITNKLKWIPGRFGAIYLEDKKTRQLKRGLLLNHKNE